MSCNHCGTKFNFFNKEMGCANCGLSLCGKCLKQKCKIPSKGSGEFNVCRICYSKLSLGHHLNQPLIYPPDKLLRRLENLENPAAPPITVYRQDPKITSLKSGLSPADQQLVDRLEKLKEKQLMTPSESEIRQRLARLKGINLEKGNSASTKPLFTADTRTDQEKVDSLLEQFSTQQDIEVAHKSQDDLGVRLASLKGEQFKANVDAEIIDQDEDSEEELKRITEKIMNEVSLEERCPPGSSSVEDAENVDDDYAPPSAPELPWCVLCNNDANYRCLDCSGDLYCRSCNIEVHKTWGDSDHRVIPYKQK